MSSILLPPGLDLPFLIDRIGKHSGTVRSFQPHGDGRLYVESESESLMVGEWLALKEFSKYLVDVSLTQELIDIHAKSCPKTLWFHCFDMHRVISLATAQWLQKPNYPTPNLSPLAFFNIVPPDGNKIGTAPHLDGDGALYSLHTVLVSPSNGANQVTLYFPPLQSVLVSPWMECFGWRQGKSPGLVYDKSYTVSPSSTVRNHSKSPTFNTDFLLL